MPASIADRRSGIASSLGARFFLLSGSLVLGTMLLAIGFIAWRAQQLAQQSVRQALAEARAAQGQVERQRLTELRLMARFLGGDPAFVAYVADGDPTSIRDLLAERRRELGFDFAAVFDRAGRCIARTDAPTAGDDLSQRPLVAEALQRGEASGLWLEDGRHDTAVAGSLVSGGEIPIGLLVLGFAVDDALALEVRRQSGAEIAYVAREAPPRVIATTLPDVRELEAALSREPRLATPGSAAADEHPLRVTLAGRRWVAEATALGPAIVAVTLGSLDEALAPFRRIRSALLLVGFGSLLVAFGLSWMFSRRVAGPLEQLADAADAARSGRYDQPLPAGGPDEVGRLARAFDGLLGELREEREMQSYLETLSRALPDRAQADAVAGILPPGTVLGGRFEIQRLIGAGGMGMVYKARDRELQDVVAIKTLRGELAEPDALDRLKSELRLARRVTHRNVLRTHEFGEADGVPFISMEFVRGVTLRTLLDHTGKLPVSVCLRLARQLLAGLEAAHALEVIHRDIKPENLILDAAGQLRVMDFGVARGGRAGIPERGELAGTSGYLAPEQLAGQRGDARGDLYACGVVLYEMLSGRRPFIGSDPLELAYRAMNEDAPALRTLMPDLPESLDRVVLRCLARDPARRWPSAETLARALAELRA